MGGARRRAGAGCLLALLALLACARPAPRPDAEPPAAGAPDPLLSRYALEQGRALLQEGRSEAAARVFTRALADDPQSAALERALARALEAQGRSDDAAAAWSRADRLAPPLPPLPHTPLPGRGAGALVAIVPAEAEAQASAAPRWPDPDLEQVLDARLALRLPDARVLRADPGSVSAARSWLAGTGAQRAVSLALERSWCGFTIKDGQLAVASLRVASATPERAARAKSLMTAIEEPRLPGDCRHEALARALERALADPQLAAALSQGAPGGAWSREALRELFPGIARRQNEALRTARALLAAGELAAAQQGFEAAAAIDPGDPDVQAFLADTALTLALARELAARAGDAVSAPQLEPRLPAERRAAAERALENEQRRRDELLAALAVLDEDLSPPPAQTLAVLHRAQPGAADAFGPRLARERAGGEVETRIAFAPDGSELARYYLPLAGGAPVLREEDTDGDGAPDRWIAYRGPARSEIFEAAGRDRPARHFVFAEGGEPLLRIEVDAAGDGAPERVFRYEAGRLLAEQTDTDGDGRLDRTDRFDATGRVASREEDLDGDGAVDVRSVYESGRLLRREFSDAALAPGS